MKCEWCGSEYERASNHQRFCSKKCQRAYACDKLRKPREDERRCPVCGNIFYTTRYSNQVCCSRDCYDEYHREKMRERRRRLSKPKRDNTGCKKVYNCFYGVNGICEYLAITGRMRGCDIDGCKRFLQRGKG